MGCGVFAPRLSLGLGDQTEPPRGLAEYQWTCFLGSPRPLSNRAAALPEKQPVASGAEVSRSWMPQKNGAQNEKSNAAPQRRGARSARREPRQFDLCGFQREGQEFQTLGKPPPKTFGWSSRLANRLADGADFLPSEPRTTLRWATSRCSYDLTHRALVPRRLLLGDLCGIGCHDFRRAAVARDRSRNADVGVRVFRLGLAELRAIAPPDQDCEGRIRVTAIEIEKRGLAFGLIRVARAGYVTADNFFFADVVLGFC